MTFPTPLFCPRSPTLKTIYLTSTGAGTWTVPSDWNSSNNTIELIGAGGGGIAGAFTYVCLLPLDTIKTKLQAKGASQLYSSSFDAVVKTFQERGILGFYSGVSAVIVGSTFSSAVYFGTCEFGNIISLLYY